MVSTKHSTILGLDPGTRFMGVAVLRGKELLDFGVHQLRNGTKPYDLIGQARRVTLRYIERYEPQVVAIEKPYRISEERAALLSAIVQELRERSKELGIDVRELSPEDVRHAVVGNTRANKIDVAEALVSHGFERLEALKPQRPVRAALGLRPKDKYWLHMFDALSLAVAAQSGVGEKTAAGT